MVSSRDAPANLPIPSKTYFKVCGELVNLGAQLAEKGMLDEATLIFEQMVLLRFGSVNLYTNLGHVYFEKGFLDKAIKYYKKAIKLAPKVEDAYELLGTLYAKKGEFGNAIPYYEKALKLNPNDNFLLTNMGKALLDEGLTEKAKEFLEKSKKFKITPVVCNLLGFTYKHLGLMEKAIYEFRVAAALEPNTWHYHSNLGDMFFEIGNWVEAINEYLKLVELVPDSVAAHNALGVAYAKNNQLLEAKQEFEKALQLDQSFEIAQQNLELVIEKEAGKDAESGITKELSLVSIEGFCEITAFEEKFRFFVTKVMERAFGPDWWERQVPFVVRDRCLKRREDKERKALEPIDRLDLIFYTDFSDYSIIIERRDNWHQVFKKYFPDQQGIMVKLTELNPIRNDIAHRAKHVTPHQLTKLKLYTNEILFCIKKETPDNQ